MNRNGQRCQIGTEPPQSLDCALTVFKEVERTHAVRPDPLDRIAVVLSTVTTAEPAAR